MKRKLIFIGILAILCTFVLDSCKPQTQCGKTKSWHRQNQKGMGDWMNRR